MLVPIKSCVIGDTIALDGAPFVVTGFSWFQGNVTINSANGEVTIPSAARVVRVAKRPAAVAFVPVDGEFYVCGVTGGEARPASEFVSGAYVGPVCKACASDFATYGCD